MKGKKGLKSRGKAGGSTRLAGRRTPKAKAMSGPSVPANEISERALSKINVLRASRKVDFARTPNNIVYWSTLLLLLICNLVVSVVLIPFIIVLSGFKFYLLIIFFALIFGFLFNLLIMDIEHIEPGHHIFAIIFIPLLAVMNIFIMVSVSNKIAQILSILKYQDPFMPSFVYSFVFLLPYTISLAKKESKKDHSLHV